MNDPGKKPDPHEATGKPSSWVARFISLIPEGETLDVACGGGRHSRLLAASGHPVRAVDRKADTLALLAAEGIRTLEVDLETGDLAQSWPLDAGRFAGIVVTNYLHRPLWQSMIASLKEGGVLIYETFAQGNGQFGKPSNPDFLLANGELLDVAREHGLRVVAYEDGYVAEPRPAMLQRICAVKPASAVKAQDFALN